MGGSPIFLPFQQQRNPWQEFFAAFVQGLHDRRQDEIAQQKLAMEEEDRNFKRQQLKFQMDELKLKSEEAKRQAATQQKAFLGGVSGPQLPTEIPIPQPSVPSVPQGWQDIPNIQDILGGPRGTMEGPMGLPSLTHTMEYPGYGQVQVPSLEGNQQIQLGEMLQKGLMEAQTAGMKEQATQKAQAPFKAAERKDTQAFDLKKLGIQEGGANRRAQMAADATRESQKLTREQQLLDDYRTETKTFSVADDQIGRIREFAKLDTGPADIGIIFSYMKMMDPESTVREGEYATAQNTGSIPSKLWAKYNQLLQGDRLAPQQRAEFLAAAETNYNVLQGRRAGIEKKFRQRANRWGLDPRVFDNPLSVDGVVDPNAGPFTGGGGQITATGPNGQKLVLRNGQWVPLQ